MSNVGYSSVALFVVVITSWCRLLAVLRTIRQTITNHMPNKFFFSRLCTVFLFQLSMFITYTRTGVVCFLQFHYIVKIYNFFHKFLYSRLLSCFFCPRKRECDRRSDNGFHRFIYYTSHHNLISFIFYTCPYLPRVNRIHFFFHLYITSYSLILAFSLVAFANDLHPSTSHRLASGHSLYTISYFIADFISLLSFKSRTYGTDFYNNLYNNRLFS